ncbi:hypothetical protein [Escherichia coli]
MARTLEELLQQEKPEVVEAAKDKAEKILRELEGCRSGHSPRRA